MFSSLMSIVTTLFFFFGMLCNMGLGRISVLDILLDIPGFSVTAPWAFIWFLDGNENTVDISIVGTNGKLFLVNAHGVLRRMGAVTEIPGTAQ